MAGIGGNPYEPPIVPAVKPAGLVNFFRNGHAVHIRLSKIDHHVCIDVQFWIIVTGFIGRRVVELKIVHIHGVADAGAVEGEQAARTLPVQNQPANRRIVRKACSGSAVVVARPSDGELDICRCDACDGGA